MTVWVKELPGFLTTDMVYPLLRKNINLLKYTSETSVEVTDCVIVSKQDEQSEDLVCNVMIYEDILEKIYSNIKEEYQKYYNRYYLENALFKAGNDKIRNIITGSSYGVFGINNKMLGKMGVNLSLQSQDLYYSIKGLNEVRKNNKNIKNIVFCVGYYYFFSDLSKTQNSMEIKRISTVYWPIFGDTHNCLLMPAIESLLFQSKVFDLFKMLREFSLSEFEKGYWNDNRKRTAYASKIWQDKTKNWLDLSEDEKYQAGWERATLHNKNKNRMTTLRENIGLFAQFASLCKDNQIDILFVVTPASRYYRKYADKEFKEIFYSILDGVDVDIHVLDLYDNDFFEEEDFIDMDHLSDLGADKMTSIIKNYITQQIECSLNV